MLLSASLSLSPPALFGAVAGSRSRVCSACVPGSTAQYSIFACRVGSRVVFRGRPRSFGSTLVLVSRASLAQSTLRALGVVIFLSPSPLSPRCRGKGNNRVVSVIIVEGENRVQVAFTRRKEDYNEAAAWDHHTRTCTHTYQRTAIQVTYVRARVSLWAHRNVAPPTRRDARRGLVASTVRAAIVVASTFRRTRCSLFLTRSRSFARSLARLPRRPSHSRAARSPPWQNPISPVRATIARAVRQVRSNGVGDDQHGNGQDYRRRERESAGE